MADNFDNYSMKVQARVDLPSNRDIDAQIRKLEKSISKLKVSGQFDDTALRNLTNQLNTLKASITTANFSPTALTELTNQVNRALQNINIGNINVGNIGNQAQQVGQQIGQQINQGVSQGIGNNDAVLNNFIQTLQRMTDMDTTRITDVADDIGRLGVTIESLNQSMSNTHGRRGDRNILSVDVSGVDQLGQAVTLTRQYNADTGELIRNVDAVSTATQRANSQLENLSAQQIKRQQDLRNQISQIYNSAIDPNASRSITDENNLAQLRTQYNAIQTAINEMGSTSKTVFAEQEANVTSLITTLKNSVSEYKNAENVSTSLKPDKLAEGISKAQSRWKALDADIKNAGVSSEKLTQQTQLITEMLGRIDGGGVLNKAEVEQVHTALTNAKNELTALVKIDASNSSLETIRLQAETLKNKLDEFSKKNTGFADWTREVNGVTVSVETLKTELDGVRTASDLRVATARVNEFESAFKAVNATASKTNVDKLNADVQTLTNNLNTFASKNAGFNTFKTDINGVEVSLDSLIQKLSTVDNNTDLSTIRSQADALKTAFSQIQDVNKIQLLSNGGIKNDYATQIAKLEGDFRSLGLAQDTIATKTQNVKNSLATLRAEFAKPVDQQNFQAIQTANDNLQRELVESRNEFEQLRASMKGMATEQQRLSLANTIKAWNQKNTAATKEVREENERYVLSLRDLSNQMTRIDFNKINTGFKQNENSMRTLHKLGASLKDQLKQAASSFTHWLSVSSGIMFLVHQTSQAVSELKELDNILTEISKTSDLTKTELEALGMSAYDSASKYGRTASDYLSGVQSMSQSGFYGEQGSAMAEQSLLAQAAGDMSQEIADKYIIATNAAYKFNGEATKLNEVLDGQNSISNRNSVSLQDMATAMSEAGTVAASYNVAVEDFSAMVGTMEAITKAGGDEVGNSAKSILINLQNVTSSKITDTLDKANASMTEFVDGVEQLRNPIDILRDLAVTFNSLEDTDPLRAEILTNVAGKYQSAKLAALLENMALFDKMLVDYSEGSGSALKEADFASLYRNMQQRTYLIAGNA